MVGGRSFPISEATRQDTGFVWDGIASFGWSVGDTVDVELRGPPETPYGDPVTGRVAVDSGWSDEYHLINSREGFIDYIVVDLEIGHRYRVQINTEPGPNPRLRIVYNPFGVIFEHGSNLDWSGGAHRQAIDIDLRHPRRGDTAGDYYIKVQGFLSQPIEPYRVRVDRR